MKNKNINIRVSDQEFQSLKNSARKQEVSISQLIREQLFALQEKRDLTPEQEYILKWRGKGERTILEDKDFLITEEVM